MCKIISFAEYKRNKRVKKTVQTEKRVEKCRELKANKLVTTEWIREWTQNGSSLSKLIFHIIEQYGYIDCRDGKRYYKLLEDLNDHFILEGTELETGNKHLALLYATYNRKKQVKYFKDKFECFTFKY